MFEFEVERRCKSHYCASEKAFSGVRCDLLGAEMSSWLHEVVASRASRFVCGDVAVIGRFVLLCHFW